MRPLVPSDLDALLDLRLRNRAFFTEFEPRRASPDAGYERTSLEELIVGGDRDWGADRGYAFGIFTGEGTLVGRVALSNIVRAAWQSCTIGYYVDQAHNGRGYATDAVRGAVSFALEHAHLHRVQAAVMPRNAGSVRVVEKAGFQREGLSRWYLQINGRWEDHEIFSITPEMRTAEPRA